MLTANPVVTSPDATINLGATASIIIAGTAEADAFVQIYSDANNNGIIDGADAVVSSQQLMGGATEFAIGTSLAQETDNNFLVTATVASDESAPTDVPTIAVFDQTLPTGGNQSTDIRQAFATTNYAIALTGIYPSRSLEADDSSNLSSGSEPAIGAIMQFAGNFAPRGWALCHGQLLSISQNDALFSILGTTYGGDGVSTFGLPDLRGRVPVGAGNGPGLTPVALGQKFGSENVTLGLNNLPSHDHDLTDGGTTGSAGGSAQAFNNRMPGLGLTPVIALQGLFPSRNLEASLASISWFAGNFAPRGYAKLDGQILPINQYQSLYSLLGTTYGGDGVTTFALPDLRGRTPVHAGDGITLGQRGGTETITLTPNTLPGHSHGIRGDSATMSTGSGQAIDLYMPYLALNFEIALTGLYPSRSQQPENPTDENGDSAFLLGDEYIDRETAYGLIQGLIDEGISRWIEAGITPEQASLLQSATYQIGDLDSGVLASVNGPNLVTIDANASSAGWFVDLTPEDDSEFGAVDETTGELLATDSAALYDYDLLTTIMHEQGHLLGLDHAIERGSVMSGILGIGGRLIPDPDDLVLSGSTDTHTELLAGSDFIAQIGMFAGNFAVRGYALTDGQLLQISQNTALFSLIGTTYGGDGRTTTALPDFRGRAIVGAGQGPGLSSYTLGQRGGANQRSLTDSNLPIHTHALSPSFDSITRQTPTDEFTSTDSVTFRITFNQDVQNVDASDFDVTGTTGTISNITQIDARIYDITISGGDLASLNGDVGLDLASGQNIQDLSGLALPGSEPPIDETYTIDNLAPTLTAFARNTPAGSPTSADTLVFDITFNEDVQNVTADDFAIVGTTATGILAGSGASYTLTLSGGDLAGLNGIVGLNLAAAQDITDLAGNALPVGEPVTDETYSVINDTTPPTLTAFARNTPATSPTNADSLVFDITFDEDVQNVSADDFDIVGTTATGVLAGSGSSYTLTLTGGDLASLNGVVGLNHSVAQNITDLAGNPLPVGDPTTDETYTIDNTAPTVTSIVRADSNPTNASSVDFTVTFSEAVTGVGTGDFVIDQTGLTGASIASISGSGTTYTVTVNRGAGDGTLSIDFDADADGGATDAASNVSSADFTAGEVYNVFDPGVLGVALDVSVSQATVTLDYYLENLGSSTLSSVALPTDLDAVFGAGNYTITTAPVLISDPGTITLNGGFDGSSDTDIIGSSLLNAGASAWIRIVLNVTSLTDQGSGIGVYSNQVTATATDAGGSNLSDLSDSGTDPDPNGNGDPTEVGENDPTPFTVAPGTIGNFVWNDLDGDGNQDGGEAGIAGVVVFIDANTNGMLDGGELFDTTDGSGQYQFTGLTEGTYSVRLDESTVPAGFVLTGGMSPLSVNLGVSEDFNTADFGLAAIETEVTLVNGVLTITDINGANSNDDLTISYAGGTYTITDNGGLVITTAIAGATGNESSTITLPDTGITSIVFDTLGGDDAVTVDSLQASLSGNFTITGGTGTDSATVNGTIATTGTGAVDITVTGNIRLNSGSSITTVDGGITLDANSSGMTAGGFNGLAAFNATIQTTGNGNISLSGRGASNANSDGVFLDAGTAIRSTSSGATAGTITIDGTGGGGTGSLNMGVYLNGAATEVSSVDGDISITGTGGGTGSGAFNYGVNLQNNSFVQVVNASMNVVGIGGVGNSAGVRLSGTSSGNLLSIGAGSITITGTGNGSGGDVVGGDASRIGFDGTNATTGDITINADTISWQGALNVESTGNLIIQPRTPGTSIGLGGGAGTLNLTDTELGFLQDGFSSITIGDTVNGTGTVDIDTATFTDPVTIAGGTINDNAGTDIDAGSNAVTLAGNVAPGQSPGVLSVAGNLSFATGSTFEAEIMGATAGTQHDQIDVVGTVNLNNATLNVDDTGFTAIGNESFTLINNDGADAVMGTFNSLAEGATVSVGGKSYTITYVGGDGNDVVLLGDMTAPTLTAFARNTPSVSLTNADTLVFDILFDEDVQNVSVDDFTINGTTASGVLTGSGSAYILTISGGDLANLNGTVSLDLAGSQDITDLNTNALPTGEPAIDETYAVENIAPTVVVNIVDTALSDIDRTSLVTFEFSEDVVDFDASDLVLVNGTISGFTMIDGNSYTATFTAANNVLGTGSVTINSGSYADNAGNLGSGGSDTVAIDTYTPDSIIGRTSGGNWWTATTNGVDGFTTEFQTTWDTAAGWTDTLLADVNGDGLDDIVSRNSSGQIHVNLATGTGFASQQQWGFWSSSVNWQDVQAGDFNGDGKMDLFGLNQGSLWVATSTGTSFSTQYWGTWANITWDDVRVADFNGDGRDDIVGRDVGNWWVATSTGTNFSTTYWGTRDHTLTWEDTNVADVNGDGMMDIVSRTSGNWWVSLSNGTSFTNQTWGYWVDSVSWINVNIADVNGDGMMDIIGRDNGNWWVALSTGSNFVNQYWGYWDSSLTWEDVTVGDFNGDGRDDVAGRTSGYWWVSRSTGTSFANELWGYWSSDTDWEDVLVGVFS